MNDTKTNVNIAAVAELIADSSRAAMLDALLGKQALPAGELAYRAGISPQTASSHLAKLVTGGLLVLTTQGRHRYYALASAEVANALEVLATLAPPAPIRTLRESIIVEHLRFARTCYDHLAGKLGVELTQVLVDSHLLTIDDGNYCVTNEGSCFLTSFGLDLERIQQQRRSFARQCLDWSERRYHLAGGLGTAILEQLFERRWIQQVSSSRAVRVTDTGREGLQKEFGFRV
ncbi:MAG: winged helix-turn-helix domain-containing protein [Ktedonobacteraceae bacterium]